MLHYHLRHAHVVELLAFNTDAALGPIVLVMDLLVCSVFDLLHCCDSKPRPPGPDADAADADADADAAIAAADDADFAADLSTETSLFALSWVVGFHLFAVSLTIPAMPAILLTVFNDQKASAARWSGEQRPTTHDSAVRYTHQSNDPPHMLRIPLTAGYLTGIRSLLEFLFMPTIGGMADTLGRKVGGATRAGRRGVGNWHGPASRPTDLAANRLTMHHRRPHFHHLPFLARATNGQPVMVFGCATSAFAWGLVAVLPTLESLLAAVLILGSTVGTSRTSRTSRLHKARARPVLHGLTC